MTTPPPIPAPDPAEACGKSGGGGSIDTSDIVARLNQLIELLLASDPEGDGIINVDAVLSLDGQCLKVDNCDGTELSVELTAENIAALAEANIVPVKLREQCFQVLTGEEQTQISAASGTLPNGVTYTVTNTDTGLTFNADGSILWENSSLLTFDFSAPVDFVIDEGLAFWQNFGGVITSVTSSGDPLDGSGVTLGTVDVTGQTATYASTSSNGFSAWGQLIAPNTTQVAIQGVGVDELNFSAVTPSGDSERFTVCHFSDGSTVITDALGELVELPEEAVAVPCSDECCDDEDLVLPHTGFGGTTIENDSAAPIVHKFPAKSSFIRSATITGIAGESTYQDPFGSPPLKLRPEQTHLWVASEHAPASIGELTIPAGGEVDVIWTEDDLTTI